MATEPRLFLHGLRHEGPPPLGDLAHMILYGLEELLELAAPGVYHDPLLAPLRTPPSAPWHLRGTLTAAAAGFRLQVRLRRRLPRAVLRRRTFHLPAARAAGGVPVRMGDLHRLHRDLYLWVAAHLELPAPPPGSYLAHRLTRPLTEVTEAYRALVLGLRAARTPREKIRWYRRAARLDGRLGRAHRNLAYLLRQEGDLEGARAAYEEAALVLIHPGALGDVYFELGLVHAAATRYGAAVRAWQRSLAFVPDRREALYNIGLAYEEMGARERARRYYERAARVDPCYLSALEGLFRLHLQAGDYRAAVAVLKRWLRVTPDDPGLHRVLGHCYRKEGRKGKALHHLRKAVELDPDGEVGREARRDILDL